MKLMEKIKEPEFQEIASYILMKDCWGTCSHIENRRGIVPQIGDDWLLFYTDPTRPTGAPLNQHYPLKLIKYDREFVPAILFNFEETNLVGWRTGNSGLRTMFKREENGLWFRTQLAWDELYTLGSKGTPLQIDCDAYK